MPPVKKIIKLILINYAKLMAAEAFVLIWLLIMNVKLFDSDFSTTQGLLKCLIVILFGCVLTTMPCLVLSTIYILGDYYGNKSRK